MATKTAKFEQLVGFVYCDSTFHRTPELAVVLLDGRWALCEEHLNDAHKLLDTNSPS